MGCVTEISFSYVPSVAEYGYEKCIFRSYKLFVSVIPLSEF